MSSRTISAFLSTPPSRVATLEVSLYKRGTAYVSIHATLAGGDATCRGRRGGVRMFLSTPPSRVATENPLYGNQWRFVSIHATLAGGDEMLELYL